MSVSPDSDDKPESSSDSLGGRGSNVSRAAHHFVMEFVSFEDVHRQPHAASAPRATPVLSPEQTPDAQVWPYGEMPKKIGDGRATRSRGHDGPREGYAEAPASQQGSRLAPRRPPPITTSWGRGYRRPRMHAHFYFSRRGLPPGFCTDTSGHVEFWA